MTGPHTVYVITPQGLKPQITWRDACRITRQLPPLATFAFVAHGLLLVAGGARW
jgi:hypothetical protein